MKQYQITLKIKTAILPKDIIWFVTQKLKGVLPIISINYEVIEDRDTSIEHHGGIDEKIPYENQKEVDAYMKQRALNNDNTKLET